MSKRPRARHLRIPVETLFEFFDAELKETKGHGWGEILFASHWPSDELRYWIRVYEGLLRHMAADA